MEETIQANRPLFSRQSLVKLIWPLIIEQTLAITVGLADSMMVASVGEAAVSGVSLVDMISVLLINVFSAMATGGAVVVSQFIGARDLKLARRSTDQLVLVTAVLSLAITALVLIFRRSMLYLFFGKVEADVMANCLTYVIITAPSYPFIALYNSAAAIFRSQNNSKLSMKVSLLMNGINLGGNAILIYIVGMGVAGVAIPTLVSRIVAAVVMMVLLCRKQNPVRMSPLREIRPNMSLISRILSIGIPSAVENGMFQFGKIIVVSMISGFGTAQITANAMGNNIANLSILMGQAMSLAIVTVVGQCVGAQDLRQARSYALKLIGVGEIMLIVSSAAVMLLFSPIIHLYGASAETAEYIRKIVTINCVSTPVFWACSFILPGALRAANDARFTSIVAVFSMWTFRVGCSYLLGVTLGWGVVGVWTAMILDWVVRDAFYVPRFLTGGWKKHAIFKPEPHHVDI